MIECVQNCKCQILEIMGFSSFYKSNIWEFDNNKKITIIFIFLIFGWDMVLFVVVDKFSNVAFIIWRKPHNSQYLTPIHKQNLQFCTQSINDPHFLNIYCSESCTRIPKLNSPEMYILKMSFFSIKDFMRQG